MRWLMRKPSVSESVSAESAHGIGSFIGAGIGGAVEGCQGFGLPPMLKDVQVSSDRIRTAKRTAKRIYAAAPNAGRTDGFLFVGTKP